MLEVLSSICLVAGAALVLIACIGLHRFDDVFARMHAAGKSSTLGLGLVLLGAGLRIWDDGPFAKLFLGGVMGLVTIPAGVHLIARAAHRSGTEVAASTTVDELAARRS